MLFQTAAHTVWSKATLAGTTHQSSNGKRAFITKSTISAIHRHHHSIQNPETMNQKLSPHKTGNNNEIGIHEE